MSDDLCDCFPGGEDLAGYAERALTGERGVPFVGDGSADTVVSCGHGEWRLGDVLAYDDGTTTIQVEGSVISEQDLTRIVQQGVQPRVCAEGGCGKAPAKNRRYCSTHASPKNRKGDGDVQEGQQGDKKDDGGEGQP